jgi:polyphenol oxidase
MPFRQIGELRVFEFSSLNHPRLTHGIFTRLGGISPAPWQSLNLGSTVGDSPEHVRGNRARLLRAVDRPEQSLHEVWQTHSSDVVVVTEPRGGAPLVQADAMITRSRNVTLLMRFADCVPILLFDPEVPAVGLAHAGWLGTVRKTAAQAVQAMATHLGSRPRAIRAALGPAIGVDHYAIGADVEQQFRLAFGAETDRHLARHNGSLHLDLLSANRALLEAEGVEDIEVAGLCTACNLSDWFSHRGEAGRTGRFGAIVALR